MLNTFINATAYFLILLVIRRKQQGRNMHQ